MDRFKVYHDPNPHLPVLLGYKGKCIPYTPNLIPSQIPFYRKMKLPNPEEFNFKECEVAGDKCWLITPKEIGCKWTDDVARFRSVIITQGDHVVVSQGFGKFTNYGERPDFEPWDDSWSFEARHKLDGSLLIVSAYKGHLVARTRGTVDARNLPNGHEIDFLIKKYPRTFDNDLLRSECCTLLFEWTTPTNVIVLREHDEPTLTLLGIVECDTLACEEVGRNGVYYWTEEWCDKKGEEWGVPRPQKYEYNTLAECLADVVAWQGKEGVVIRKGQIRRKIKSDLYCEAHKVATGFTTIGHVIDLFMASPRFAKYSDFYSYVEKVIDFEVAEKIKDHMLTICVGWSKVLSKLESVKSIVNTVRSGFTRREQAQDFQQHYPANDWRLPIAFKILDNKTIPDKLLETALVAEIVNS